MPGIRIDSFCKSFPQKILEEVIIVQIKHFFESNLKECLGLILGPGYDESKIFELEFKHGPFFSISKLGEFNQIIISLTTKNNSLCVFIIDLNLWSEDYQKEVMDYLGKWLVKITEDEK